MRRRLTEAEVIEAQEAIVDAIVACKEDVCELT